MTLYLTAKYLFRYSIVRLDCSRYGSGVLIYVKDLFTCSPLFKGTPDFECLIVTVKVQLVQALILLLLFSTDHLVLAMLFWIHFGELSDF